LLTFARVRDVKCSDLNVRAFLADLSSSLKLDPALCGVEIRMTDVPDDVIAVDVDQFRLVLMNLLLNAAQAMNNTGTITVAVHSRPDEIEVEIADQGPGVSPEARDRLFEPFFTTKHRGTGLGLPTARRMVEAHGGQLSIASAPDAAPGTVARVRLPRRPARA
jgi:two-component system sensor histidine kinase HydH